MRVKTLTEYEGVVIEIEYDEPNHVDGPLITSARVLDGDYRATGPNLLPLLDRCFLQTAPAEATWFLSQVVSEITS